MERCTKKIEWSLSHLVLVERMHDCRQKLRPTLLFEFLLQALKSQCCFYWQIKGCRDARCEPPPSLSLVCTRVAAHPFPAGTVLGSRDLCPEGLLLSCHSSTRSRATAVCSEGAGMGAALARIRGCFPGADRETVNRTRDNVAARIYCLLKCRCQPQKRREWDLTVVLGCLLPVH